MHAFKKLVYDHFSKVINEKLSIVSKDLHDLAVAAASETKSTAGDKHETALAMLQIEQANKNKQKDELLAQKAVMQKTDPSITTVSVVQGSLVKTQEHCFFVSAALGKTQVDGKTVFAISAQSPIGQVMMGLKVGERFSINQANYLIEAIQ